MVQVGVFVEIHPAAGVKLDLVNSGFMVSFDEIEDIDHFWRIAVLELFTFVNSARSLILVFPEDASEILSPFITLFLSN